MRPTVIDTWNYVAISHITNTLTLGTSIGFMIFMWRIVILFFMREDMSVQ